MTFFLRWHILVLLHLRWKFPLFFFVCMFLRIRLHCCAHVAWISDRRRLCRRAWGTEHGWRACLTDSENCSHRCSRPALTRQNSRTTSECSSWALTDKMDMETHQKPENHVKTLQIRLIMRRATKTEPENHLKTESSKLCTDLTDMKMQEMEILKKCWTMKRWENPERVKNREDSY